MWNPAPGSGVYPVMPTTDDLFRPDLAPSGSRSAVAATVHDALAPPELPTELPAAPTEPPAASSTRVEEADPAALVRVASLEFSDFYRASWRPVARGLAVTLGDRDLAAEATDEAMARAYPRWATLHAYDNPAGWVYRVGLNWARSYRRRAVRMIPFLQHDTVDLDPVEDPAIRAALMDLSVDHRSVVVCRLLLDWSVDDTAEALSISPGTVKSRLHRALTILESTLANQR